MYDKVKARSNRACKNVAASKVQQEEQKKHDKLHESFNQLKKSRYVCFTKNHVPLKYNRKWAYDIVGLYRISKRKLILFFGMF